MIFWIRLKIKLNFTEGQFAAHGVPQLREILSSWICSVFAWNIGFLVNSSPSMQLKIKKHFNQKFTHQMNNIKNYEINVHLPTAPNINCRAISFFTK